MARIDSLEKEVITLRRENISLRKENSELRKENSELRLRLKEKGHKKDSSNSSVPPSKDENRFRKNQSLREKGKRPNGGQKGHKGTTLEFISNPDKIIDHIPKHCSSCQEELKSDLTLVDQRQIIDIPPIQAKVYQHNYYERLCNCCGLRNSLQTDNLPKAKVYYGPKIEAMIGYLNVRQYLSINRIAEMMNQVFGVPLSEGTVVNKLNSLSSKCKTEYDQIIHQLFACNWVGSDETSFKMNGKKHWLWTWQNDKFTYLFASQNRASSTVSKVLDGITTLFAALVHDCYPSHFSIKAKIHQICLAHLLRELNYLIEKRNSTWPYKFKKALLKAIRLHKKDDYQPNSKAVAAIKKEVFELIDEPVEKEKGAGLRNFMKRMKKYKDYILPFLDYPEIPPDNNGSERSIRNVKVKLKIAGQFKTSKGANSFAIIRSIIDTALKQKQDPLQKLMSFT